LLLKPCNSIHSFFMKFSFDVLFLDSDYIVVYKIERMCPYRVSPAIRKAKMTLELPVGSISKSNTQLGDQLLLKGGDVGLNR
jgi:uncharacterized membrane protein (UPF0127 family)